MILEDLTYSHLVELGTHPWTSKQEVLTILEERGMKNLGWLNDGIKAPDLDYTDYQFNNTCISINHTYDIYFQTDMS